MIIMDGVQRIAMVETKTIEGGAPIATPVPKHRFQLGNHLDSALLEVDETGLIISYEEYAPYGTSAYRSAKSGVEVSARRYRYTGKERDDETGLYYYGARYYAAWLGRWTSADPLGIGADGPGLYNYVRGSPVTLTDPNGAEGKDPNEQGWWRRGLQAIAKPLFQATYAPASLLNAAELAGVVDQGTTQAAAEMYVGAGVRAVEQAKAAANPIGTAIETVTRLNQSVEQKGVTQTVRDASPFGNADRASDALSRNDYIEAGKELFDIAMFITGVTKSVASGRPAKINLPPPPAVAVGPEFALAGASVAHVPAAIVALGQIAAMSVASGSGGEHGGPKSTEGPQEAASWKTPEEWAEHDHGVVRDRLRKEKSGFESGRHNEYPAAMRDTLRRLADEAEGRGDLPEYAQRLRDIADTYDKRAREGHRGGR
jgi:RHS repeat-associated protein